jgi:E-phenylitaconyl-CoA hydratase
MKLETLLYDVKNGVATITLNRPDRHNAFNVAMANELKRAWDAVKTDPEVVCAIVTGAGEKAFCTGMDVADVASGEAKGTGTVSREDAPWFRLTAIQNKCWKPVITAVNGMVVGGGLHFIADSDLIVASESASFFDTHVKVGLIAGIEPVGLTRRIPLESVLRMALLGGSERLDAQGAKDLGLVGEIVPHDQLLTRARELADKYGGAGHALQELQVVVDDRRGDRRAGDVDDARARQAQQHQHAQQALLVVRQASDLGHDVRVEAEARHAHDGARLARIGEHALKQRLQARLQAREGLELLRAAGYRRWSERSGRLGGAHAARDPNVRILPRPSPAAHLCAQRAGPRNFSTALSKVLGFSIHGRRPDLSIAAVRAPGIALAHSTWLSSGMGSSLP